jgi:hypothetical protein
MNAEDATGRRRQYPWRGAAVNPDRPAPSAPGPWVDETRCAVCGASYRAHRGSYSGDEAARQLRAAAKAAGDDGGGYRSRRAVLWWLRCLKLEDWYLSHLFCGEGWDPNAGRPHPLEDRAMTRARLPPPLALHYDRVPEVIFIRGHFDPDDDRAPDAIEAAGLELDRVADDLDRDSWTRPRLVIGRRLWARWGFGRSALGTMTAGHLYLGVAAKRGAFPVTEVLDLDAREAREARELARCPPSGAPPAPPVVEIH